MSETSHKHKSTRRKPVILAAIALALPFAYLLNCGFLVWAHGKGIIGVDTYVSLASIYDKPAVWYMDQDLPGAEALDEYYLWCFELARQSTPGASAR